jgi:transposase
VPAEDLVFGDQMGCNRSMTPTHGRAESGKRVVDSVPKNHGKNISVMGMMALSGIVCLAAVEGAYNADLVYEYFKDILLRKLRPGQVVILDNARIHKKREAELRTLLASKGCRLMFLPPYTPEWNPIEPAWSKMKQIISRLKARTKEAVLEAIRFAREKVTSTDARGWFRLCGFVSD